MLQAKTNTGELIMLTPFSRKEIDVLRRKESFYCPVCDEQVIIKAGKQVIPHFAHRHKSNCYLQEGGEGAYHEAGKLQLYHWLQQQRLPVKLEHYLPEINQRPDLFLEFNNRRIVIEFQCARVPIEQIQARNKGYLQTGIVPIWILGANLFKRLSTNHLKLDQFLRQFIHKFSIEHPPSLYFFHPENLQFVSFQHIYPATGKKAIGTFLFQSLSKLLFSEIFAVKSLSEQLLYELWSKEKSKWRVSKRIGKWYKWLYEKGTNIDYLPSCIHLPVPGQILMKSPLWEWQSKLCLELIRQIKIGDIFTLQTCFHLLKDDYYSPENYPLFSSTINPIEAYLKLLEALQIIQEVSPNQYIKIHPLLFHTNLFSAMHEDRQVCNILKQIKKQA
ncbi:competence protein CoiA [Ornithinibacillus sp. 4-3]|uniref:Competence protein CoiA n=1 Tax=Ornithinibacillus sp. 4-3 TaxID=3231488 RepID=A0AB39HRX3_9BACI